MWRRGRLSVIGGIGDGGRTEGGTDGGNISLGALASMPALGFVSSREPGSASKSAVEIGISPSSH